MPVPYCTVASDPFGPALAGPLLAALLGGAALNPGIPPRPDVAPVGTMLLIELVEGALVEPKPGIAARPAGAVVALVCVAVFVAPTVFAGMAGRPWTAGAVLVGWVVV